MNSNNQIDYTLTSVDENDKKQRKRISIHGVPIYAAVLLLLSLILLLIWAIVMDRKLPTQIKIAEEVSDISCTMAFLILITVLLLEVANLTNYKKLSRFLEHYPAIDNIIT